MLYKFFITQWFNPDKGDWSELVKEDLKDFGINNDFELIKKMKPKMFKTLVKKKVNEYALQKLNEMKGGRSKMKHLKYTEIKMQTYMKSNNITMKEALNLFKFRTRMAEFGENYRAGIDVTLCPLCLEGIDSQDHSFQCSKITEKVEIRTDISEVYSNSISQDTAKDIDNIIRTRKKLINENTLE